MNRLQLIATTVLCIAVVATARASAQCDTCHIAILQLTVGARPLAVGGAFVTGSSAEALFQNPAQAGSARGTYAGAERIGDATLAGFATTGSLGSFGIGAAIRVLEGGSRTLAGSEDQLPGGAVVAGVVVARDVRGIRLGGAINFVTPDLLGGGGPSFDVGASARYFGLRFGLAAQNLGRDFQVDGVRQVLPRRLTLGASLPTRSISTYFDFGASAAVTLERDKEIVPSGGVELTYEPVQGWDFTARVGAHRPVNRPGELRQSAVAIGGSFGLNSLSLDYTFAPAVSGGTAIHSVGIRIQ